MSTRGHLLPHRASRREHPPDDARTRRDSPDPGGMVFRVQLTGAICVGGFLLVFGLVGLAGGLAFLSTDGERVLGLSSNGLLSTLSVVVGIVLVGAAWLGPRIASAVMMVLGCLFLVSALVNLAVLSTGLNILAFKISNVVFSIVVGLLLLTLGAYGRVSGNLPPDSPYAHPHPDDTEPPESYPSTPEEFAAEAAMREAELAVCEHRATDEQRRRVQAMAVAHTRADRRRIWLELEAAQAASTAEAATSGAHASRLSQTVAQVRGRQHGSRRSTGK
jgi:hypothetical protein